MTASMFGYFDKVVYYLSTEGRVCEVIAEGKNSVVVVFRDKDGGEILKLHDQHVRDILNAMKDAKKAAGLVQENFSGWRREEKEE